MAARPLAVVKPTTPQPTAKQRREAAEALHEHADQFLECRDLRHPWTPLGCFLVGREVHRRLICDRCGTQATDRWTPKGGRIARQYNYPKGYTIKGVKIRPTDVRREVLARVTVYATEEQMKNSLFSSSQRKRA